MADTLYLSGTKANLDDGTSITSTTGDLLITEKCSQASSIAIGGTSDEEGLALKKGELGILNAPELKFISLQGTITAHGFEQTIDMTNVAGLVQNTII
jgi:hypothetical protein